MEWLLHFFSYSASFKEGAEEAVKSITRISPTNIPWAHIYLFLMLLPILAVLWGFYCRFRLWTLGKSENRTDRLGKESGLGSSTPLATVELHGRPYRVGVTS